MSPDLADTASASTDLADTASASTDLIDVADSDCQGPHAEQYTQCTVAPDLADTVYVHLLI